MYLYHFLNSPKKKKEKKVVIIFEGVRLSFFSRTSTLRVWNTISQISARHLLPKKKKKKKKKKLRKLADIY
jgi:hypothetical protein